MQEIQELKLFCHNNQFLHCFFNEKLCKTKAFDAYPTLELIGGSDSLLSLIESFLSNKFHRVLLNGQTWLPIKNCVTLGSILGSLFSLILMICQIT